MPICFPCQIPEPSDTLWPAFIEPESEALETAGTKKPPLGGGFFEHITFTGDGFSRVAEVESCTLSSTMCANYREKVRYVSIELTKYQLNLTQLKHDPFPAGSQGLHHSPAPTPTPTVLPCSRLSLALLGQYGMSRALDSDVQLPAGAGRP